MHKDSGSDEKPKGSEIVKKGDDSQPEHRLQMMLQRVIGEDSYQPTTEQVDEILSQKREVYGYIREGRKEEHERLTQGARYGLFYFFGTLIFVLLMAVAVLIWKPEYLTQVLTGLFGFAGGFGVGQYKAKNPDND